MLLRPYQEIAVSSAIDALDKHGNTVVVAPTGAGKTIMLSSLIGKRHSSNKNVLVLQHRDELVNQNMDKFKRINPNISTSIVNAQEKNWKGDAVFSMVQTLCRPNNLQDMKATTLSQTVIYTLLIMLKKLIKMLKSLVSLPRLIGGIRKVSVRSSPTAHTRSKYQPSFVKVFL